MRTIFNVQILNSAFFRKATGNDPPSTPVTAAKYADYGYPYYSIFDEMPSGVKGDFAGIKSVNMLDTFGKPSPEKAHAAAEVTKSTNNPVVLLDSRGDRVGFCTVSKLEEEVHEKSGSLRL